MATSPTDKTQPQSQQQPPRKELAERREQGQERALEPVRRRPISNMLAPLTGGPFTWMRRMLEDMDQLVGLTPFMRAEGMPNLQLFVPQVDVEQRGDRVIVHADLPGLSPDDVRLEVIDGNLHLEGERKSESESESGGVMRTERYFGQFQRVVPLPEGTDPDSAEARFENGVLEVTFNAPQRAKGRQIEIRSGAQAARKESTKH